MIISYKFKNFCSYRDNVEFSMLAPASKVKSRFGNNYVATKSGYDINKSCVIVGENAGGKTNFVRSFIYLKMLLSSNERIKAYSSTINSNCMVEADYSNDIEDERLKQQFELEVLINGKVYSYFLEIDMWGVVQEKLKVKKSKTANYKSILSVKREKYEIAPGAKEGEQEIRFYNSLSFIGKEKYDKSIVERMKKEASSGLFVNKLAILAVEDAYVFVDWVSNSLSPISHRFNLDFVKAVQNEDNDKDIIRDPRFIEILRMIDYSIKEIEINEENPYEKTILIRKGKNGAIFKREIENDSSGIGEYFAWAIQIFKVVYMNQCVIADEVDRVLNPVLSDRIVAFINGKEHTGQFIFTTHNVLHLDLKNYMKEQIYFATKDIETLESELYSLADFPEVRYEVTKVYEFYMKGILGGVANE